MNFQYWFKPGADVDDAMQKLKKIVSTVQSTKYNEYETNPTDFIEKY